MRHHSRRSGRFHGIGVLSLRRVLPLLAVLVACFAGCRATQTDEFPTKPKAPAASTQPDKQPTAPRRTTGEPALQTESFEAKPKTDGKQKGPGPNADAALSVLAASDEQMEVHFIQVGQGDATLLKLPNHQNILVDAGSLLERDPQALRSYLEGHLDNHRIDTLVITHPDADHYNLLPFVVSGLQVGQVLMIGGAHEYGANANVDKATSQRQDGFQHWLEGPPAGTRVQAIGPADRVAGNQTSNTLFHSGTTDISILSAEFEHDTNSRSIVLLVSFGQFDLLLMGDAEEEVENDILSRYDHAGLDVECLKLGHHGSRNAQSKPWLDVVKPEVAIASAAEGPKHGHPNQAFKAELESHTIAAQPHRILWWENKTTSHETTAYTEAVYSTATNGTIVLKTNGQTFTLTYEGSQPVDPGASLRIVAALPDPAGADAPAERVRLHNSSAVPVPLTDWRIADSSGSFWQLTAADGPVPANGDIEVVRKNRNMSLNNEGGDSVVLLTPAGVEVGRQAYGDATEGKWITF